MIVFKLLSRNFISEINGCISTGKEANVYHATTRQGEHRAIKVSLVIIAALAVRARRALLLISYVPLIARMVLTVVSYVPLRARRALTLISYVPLITRRALTLLSDVSLRARRR